MKLLARFHSHESPSGRLLPLLICRSGPNWDFPMRSENNAALRWMSFCPVHVPPKLMLFHPSPASGSSSEESGSKDGLGDLSSCPLVHVDIIFNTSRCQAVTSYCLDVILGLHHHPFPFLALALFVSGQGTTRDSGQLAEHTDYVSMKSNQGLKSPVPAQTCHTHRHPTSLSSNTTAPWNTLNLDFPKQKMNSWQLTCDEWKRSERAPNVEVFFSSFSIECSSKLEASWQWNCRSNSPKSRQQYCD